MPHRIPGWINKHPNLFALILVTLVFVWAVTRIGNEADKRVQSERRFDNRLSQESKARQEIICLIANDGVDRDRAFIEALIAASEAGREDRVETSAETARREQATKIFFERLEPALRPIECQKFIQDPVRYLNELRMRVDINTPTTTTTVRR